MGNCLALQEKPIIIMKTDGEILKYTAPMKVQQLLSDYPDHAISDTLPITRHLQADTDMLPGNLYYLLPLQAPVPEYDKKSTNIKEVNENNSGVMRIKLVITKQELEMMLSKGGVSVEDMISQLQKKQCATSVDRSKTESNNNFQGWRPVLESIPEVN